jgi:hypothetical protein
VEVVGTPPHRQWQQQVEQGTTDAWRQVQKAMLQYAAMHCVTVYHNLGTALRKILSRARHWCAAPVGGDQWRALVKRVVVQRPDQTEQLCKGLDWPYSFNALLQQPVQVVNPAASWLDELVSNPGQEVLQVALNLCECLFPLHRKLQTMPRENEEGSQRETVAHVCQSLWQGVMTVESRVWSETGQHLHFRTLLETDENAVRSVVETAFHACYTQGMQRGEARLRHLLCYHLPRHKVRVVSRASEASSAPTVEVPARVSSSCEKEKWRTQRQEADRIVLERLCETYQLDLQQVDQRWPEPERLARVRERLAQWKSQGPKPMRPDIDAVTAALGFDSDSWDDFPIHASLSLFVLSSS